MTDDANVGSDRDKERRARCLLWMAGRHGPVIDQVDVVGDGGEFTRDVLAHLVDEKVGCPAELRVSVRELVDAGHLCFLADRELYSRHSRIGLTEHGLLEARRLNPGVGVPAKLSLQLSSSRDALKFAARFDTGGKERDKKLNGSGVVLSCFYLLAIEHPDPDAPASLDWFHDRMGAMAMITGGSKGGKGDRLVAGVDTVADALKTLQGAFRGVLHLECANNEQDGRRRDWYLSAPFPGVRMIASRSNSQLGSWDVFLTLLRQEFVERLEDWQRQSS